MKRIEQKLKYIEKKSQKRLKSAYSGTGKGIKTTRILHQILNFLKIKISGDTKSLEKSLFAIYYNRIYTI
jgi:hypothetical protein